MGLGNFDSDRGPQSAECDYCGGTLEFPTDDLGRTLVGCSDPRCPNHHRRLLSAGVPTFRLPDLSDRIRKEARP